MEKTIVAFSGHRPQKLGGYNIPNKIYNYITQQLKQKLLELKPDKCISGMALGWDQWAAETALDMKIPLLAAVPFQGQERIWPKSSQAVYQQLLAAAAEVVVVCEGGYAPQKMQIRNQWMTDNCDILLCCYNGDKTGGTANCIEYARKIGREIIIIDPTRA